MATLSFRLPASRQDRPLRRTAWSRGALPVQGRHPNPNAALRGLVVVTDVVDLQAPMGLSMIEMPESSSASAVTAAGDRVAPGWFDSTWDLQQGLEISEGLPSDLPLDCWLHAYLAP